MITRGVSQWKKTDVGAAAVDTDLVGLAEILLHPLCDGLVLVSLLFGRLQLSLQVCTQHTTPWLLTYAHLLQGAAQLSG